MGRSPIRQAVLERVIEDPEVGVSARGLAKTMGVHHGWVSVQLKALEEEGVLRSKPGLRQRILYFLDEESEAARAVRTLVRARSGVRDRLRSALVGAAGAEEIVLMPDAGGESDVEIMVIGTADAADVDRRLRGAAAKLGRQVSPTMLSREELDRRVQMRRLYEEGEVIWRRRRVAEAPAVGAREPTLQAAPALHDRETAAARPWTDSERGDVLRQLLELGDRLPLREPGPLTFPRLPGL